MARKKRNRVKYFLVAVVLFAIMFAGAFLGIQYFTKTGIFRIKLSIEIMNFGQYMLMNAGEEK